MLAALTGGVAAAPATANASGNVLVGGFEIDGNYHRGFGNGSTAGGPVDPRGDDWGTVEGEAGFNHTLDGTGAADDTLLGGGHEDEPLSTWAPRTSGSPQSAADINNAWSYTRIVNDETYAFFAWDRFATQGQVTWYLELDQKPNTVNGHGVSVPDRTPGDIRIQLQRSQSTLQVMAVDRWTGPADTAWTPAPDTRYDGLVNDSTISTPDGSKQAQMFMEFGFNISALFGQDSCGVGDFRSMNLRSAAGGATSQLQDYVHADVDIQSPCASLTIEKVGEDGEPVGGAEFTSSPNPLPGRPPAPPLTITDNGTGDADDTEGVIRIPAVEPGTYTVTESSPPPGYIPDPDPRSVTLEEFGDESLTFRDSLGSISWAKTDADTGEPVCCATFTVRGTGGAAAADPWNVRRTVTDDDPAQDGDPAPGRITVRGLPTGTYTITEIEPPQGYTLPADPSVSGVEISAADPDPSIGTPFADPQARSELSVRKINARTGETQDGAVFQLYRDDGDGVQDAPIGGDTPVGGPCTTGRDGPGLCTVRDLPFGVYYWLEISPPPGFDVPADRTSPMIQIDAGNAGQEMTPYEFTNPRRPGALRVRKLAAPGGAPQGGGEFDLYLDDGNGEFDDADTLAGTCTTLTDGPDEGTCTIEDLDHGTYFWVERSAPPGYALADPAVSDPVVIDAGNVDQVQQTTFTDQRERTRLTVRKLDEVTGDPLPGARFNLARDDGDGSFDPGRDQTIGTCVTGDDGTCSIGDLDFGTYFWFEAAAPNGYDLPEDRVRGPITIDADNAGTAIDDFVFTDPRLRSELTVAKVDEETGAPLEDAAFALYEDVDGDGADGVAEGSPDPDDTVVSTCVTRLPAGTCTIGDLDFGTYYWFELSATHGYVAPDRRVGSMITIDASNAGSELEAYTFANRRDEPTPPPTPGPTPTPTPTPTPPPGGGDGGGDGGGGGPGAGQGPGAGGPSGPAGDDLPFTGFSAVALLAGAIVLISAGVLIRARRFAIGRGRP